MTNILMRASAGSGKTYALTTQYLRLLFERRRATDSPEIRLDSLLAATFTRKAAGEVFDRILTRLAAAALDDNGALEEMRDAIGESSLTQSQCREALLHLCQSLHRLSIGTLDSFFQRLCALYWREAGLVRGARLSDGNDPHCVAMQQEAMRNMLAKIPAPRMTELLDSLTNGQAGSSVLFQLQQLAATATPSFDDASDSAWDSIVLPDAPTEAQVARALEVLSVQAAQFRLPSWRKAVDDDVAAFAARRWEDFLAKGLSAGCRKEEPRYGSSKDPIPKDVVESYKVLHDVAKGAILGALRDRTLAIRAVLGKFLGEYHILRQREGVMLFDEPPRLVQRFASDPRETARRMGVALDHLLLDEFQDTSDAQWSVLQLSAIPASVNPSGSVFVVGDAKQAIYGWRGGRAEIFERLAATLPGMEMQTRAVSYRSSQTILDAVNTVFERLADNEALRDHQPAAQRWADYFQPHQAHKKLPGYVELAVSPMPEDNSDTENDDQDNSGASPHILRSASKIAKIARGLPAETSVGILVRTNKTAENLANLLRAEGIEISSEGAGRIVDDPAVDIVLSAFTLADHPGHTAAAFHVAHSPLAEHLGFLPTQYADGRAAAKVSSTLRKRILAMGYAGLIAEWAAMLAPYGVERTARRLEQLVDLAAKMDSLPPMRASEFVAAVRDSAVENPGAASVRVMTINRAKGLEFDAVFLPELDWKLRGTGKSLLVKRASVEAIASGSPPIEAIYGYPTKLHCELSEPIAIAAAEACAEEITGTLCLLYVAMTRARSALYLFVPPRRINKDGKPGSIGFTPAAILRNTLGDGTDDSPQGPEWTTLFSEGSLPSADRESPPIQIEPTQSIQRPSLQFRPSSGRRRGATEHSIVNPRSVSEILNLDRGREL